MQINNSFEVQKRRLLSTFGSPKKEMSLNMKSFKDSDKIKFKHT